MVVTTIENVDTLPDFQVAVQKLLEQEEKMKERQTEKDITQALYVKKQSNISKKCNHCHKVGHIAKDCWILHPELKKNNVKCRSTGEKSNQVMSKTNSSENCVGLVANQACALSNHRNINTWVIDSGATSHMTFEKNLLTEFTELKHSEEVSVGDGRTLEIKGRGSVIINVSTNHTKNKLKLRNVLYVPKLSFNLLSVSKASNEGIIAIFSKNKCSFVVVVVVV